MFTSTNRPSPRFAALAAALAVLSPVAAHGVVEQVSIGSQVFKAPGPIRQVRDNGPVTVNQLDSSDLTCGLSAKLASETAPATAGSTVEFSWSASWPHTKGPILTYMAACEGPCASYNPATAQWFKIDQQGLNADGTWEQAKMPGGGPITVKIPSTIRDGEYLIRQEIVNLGSIPQELYPSCTQLKITGGGNAVPSETVIFPGGYTKSDPGLAVGDVWSIQDPSQYKFPGPAVFQDGASPTASAGTGRPASPTLSSASTQPAASTTAAATTPASAPTTPATAPILAVPSSSVAASSADAPTTAGVSRDVSMLQDVPSDDPEFPTSDDGAVISASPAPGTPTSSASQQPTSSSTPAQPTVAPQPSGPSGGSGGGYDDGIYHPDPSYDDGSYHPSKYSRRSRWVANNRRRMLSRPFMRRF